MNKIYVIHKEIICCHSKLCVQTTSNIILPKNSKILSAKIQDKNIVVWYLKNINETKLENYIFDILWTGVQMNNYIIDRTFLTTLIGDNGLVYHVFYMKKKELK